MHLFLLQNGSLNLVRNLSPDFLIKVKINLLPCGIHSIANDNHRIKMIKVSIMSLELVVHSTLRVDGAKRNSVGAFRQLYDTLYKKETNPFGSASFCQVSTL